MKIKFLNRTVDPKRFAYNPRYYDEQKERLNQRREHYRKVHSGEYSEDDRREHFKQNLRAEWSRSEIRHQNKRSANIRTLILVVIIVALGFFIFNGVDEVDTIVNKVW